MFVLPDALASLGGYRQFVVYRLQPSTRKPGKTDKMPIDWRTGRMPEKGGDGVHDPAIWLTWQEAAAYAEAFGTLDPANQRGHGVGFVFTTGDPFWFADLDKCLLPDGSGWSPLAMEVLGRFSGAAVEVSQSGQGLHIIGCGVAPPHAKRNDALGLEFYTEARFVALTGDRAIGNAWTDHTPAVAAYCAQYFPPKAADTGSKDWTTEACAEWRGPDDDHVLIARAKRSSSVASTFGAKAAFADLWEADEAKLAKAYPDTERAYNASSADMALAQHLAFWTGKNCERIERLMLQSALRREKWEDRLEGYLHVTIMNAVAQQKDVLIDKPIEAASAMPPPPPSAPAGVGVVGETYLSAGEQINLFRGCVYVCNLHKVLVPGGHLLKPDQFKVMFGGYSFPMDPINERISRNAWEAFTESQSYRSPRADTICFRPEHPPGSIVEEAGVTLANVWWPIETPRAAGDVGPFLRHIAKLLPDADDQAKLLAYIAALVQYPGKKFQWAPLLQGTKGNGKTIVISAVSRAVGDRYTHLPNTSSLMDGGLKFTGWLNQKLFIGLEEIYAADRREMLEALKPIITNTRVEIQGKGQDQITGDNRANIIACSNHKDAVPKTNDERRWAIFYTAQQQFEDLARDGMDGGYFPDLWDWFEGREKYAGQAPGYAIINDFLRSYQIPAAMNPAGLSHRAPDTSTTAEAKSLSLGAIEQEIMEAIEEGRPGFAGGWVSSMAVDKMLVRLRADRRVPPRKRREMLVEMGFDYHPHLEGGRVNVTVSPDGGKPRLFIKKGSLLGQFTDPRTIASKYETDQNAAAVSAAKFGS